jgi:putative oxygen-independent coproporphyrinogen III oxidase
MTQKISVYIHWPYCEKKCPYCDFNSHVREEIDHAEIIPYYEREIQSCAEILRGKQISSVFFGGGTPSLAEPIFIERCLRALGQVADLPADVEITLEANPSSSEAAKFKAFKLAGINRLSIGVQSFDDQELEFLGRLHDSKQAYKALEAAAKYFDRYSFDLIYALPEQTPIKWQKQLKDAIGFARGHMSLYQLTIEKGTKFFSLFKSGKFRELDADVAAQMYMDTEDIMNLHNMPAYEVSNYATPGQESVHNLNYWHYGEYLGIGPGAHSRFAHNGKLYEMVMIYNPEKWQKTVENFGVGIHSKEIIPISTAYEEALMMRLRLVTGVQRDFIRNQGALEELLSQNLLEAKPDGMVAPTLKGRLLLNSILQHLLAGGGEGDNMGSIS